MTKNMIKTIKNLFKRKFLYKLLSGLFIALSIRYIFIHFQPEICNNIYFIKSDTLFSTFIIIITILKEIINNIIDNLDISDDKFISDEYPILIKWIEKLKSKQYLGPNIEELGSNIKYMEASNSRGGTNNTIGNTVGNTNNISGGIIEPWVPIIDIDPNAKTIEQKLAEIPEKPKFGDKKLNIQLWKDPNAVNSTNISKILSTVYGNKEVLIHTPYSYLDGMPKIFEFKPEERYIFGNIYRYSANNNWKKWKKFHHSFMYIPYTGGYMKIYSQDSPNYDEYLNHKITRDILFNNLSDFRWQLEGIRFCKENIQTIEDTIANAKTYREIDSSSKKNIDKALEIMNYSNLLELSLENFKEALAIEKARLIECEKIHTEAYTKQKSKILSYMENNKNREWCRPTYAELVNDHENLYKKYKSIIGYKDKGVKYEDFKIVPDDLIKKN